VPSLHQYFGVDNIKVLGDAVRESGPIQDFAHHLPERTSLGDAQWSWVGPVEYPSFF